MKKFLVPTDFSETSKNAARYAAQMLNGKRGTQMVLYYVYDGSSANPDGTLLTDEDDKDREIILQEALLNMKDELVTMTDTDILTISEKGSSLIESIDRYVRHNLIDMVVMGITGTSKLEQIFMGSNTLKLVNDCVCPVMIVPPDAHFVEIKEVGITSDFKDVRKTTPFGPIKALLDIFKPTLYIINVDVEHYVQITEEYKSQKDIFDEEFKDYNPQYAFMRLYDFQDAIDSFAKDYEIDFIITVPRKHSFLGGLFKSSTTKKMVYHSRVPIVAIHE